MTALENVYHQQLVEIPIHLSEEERYFMKLANGQGWCITATRGVRSWVKRLASLMELKTCQGNGCPRLIFIKQESDKK